MMWTHLLAAGFIMTLAGCTSEPAGGNRASTDGAGKAACGKAVFIMNCAACHNPIKDATGPALKGSLARWDNDTGRMLAFIRNPAAIVARGDARAKAVYGQYGPTMMTAFPTLSATDMNCLLDYIRSL